MKNKNKLLAIPPYWIGVFGALLCGGYFAVLIFLEVDARYPKIDPWAVEIILICFLIKSSICYDFRENQLVVKLLTIPIRIIAWNRISCAVYIPEWKYKYNFKRSACVILTVHPGKPYRPSSQKESLFLIRNPFSTIRLNLHDSRDEACVEVLTRCIGSVERIKMSSRQ